MQAPLGSGNSVFFTRLREINWIPTRTMRTLETRLIYWLPLPSEIKSINAAVSQGIKLLTTALIVSRLPACVICCLLFSVFLCDFYAKRLWSTLRYCTVKLRDSLLSFFPLIKSTSGQIKEILSASFRIVDVKQLYIRDNNLKYVCVKIRVRNDLLKRSVNFC